MRNSTTQPFVCDTGCSFPVISDRIIHDMGIPIRPFKTGKQLNIVDASGNSLHLLGSASFFIQIPQVLGEKVERVEAAVLADNDVDSELLISLSLLVAWDLVPPSFPRQTVSAYFREILTKNKIFKKYKKSFLRGMKACQKMKIVTNCRNPAHLALS